MRALDWGRMGRFFLFCFIILFLFWRTGRCSKARGCPEKPAWKGSRPQKMRSDPRRAFCSGTAARASAPRKWGSSLLWAQKAESKRRLGLQRPPSTSAPPSARPPDLCDDDGLSAGTGSVPGGGRDPGTEGIAPGRLAGGAAPERRGRATSAAGGPGSGFCSTWGHEVAAGRGSRLQPGRSPQTRPHLGGPERPSPRGGRARSLPSGSQLGMAAFDPICF